MICNYITYLRLGGGFGGVQFSFCGKRCVFIEVGITRDAGRRQDGLLTGYFFINDIPDVRPT